MRYKLLDEMMELQEKFEEYLTGQQTENTETAEIGKSVLEAIDESINHYSAWLAAMDDQAEAPTESPTEEAEMAVTV